MKKALRDQLAAFRTRMGQREAELSATPEQNEAKRKFGRIFQANHTSLRLAQRDLDEIDREAARPRLLEIAGDRAVLFFKRTKKFVPIVRRKRKNRADDWFATTAYEVRSEQEATRKAAKDNSQLIVVEESASRAT